MKDLSIEPSDIRLQLQKIEIDDEKESGKFIMKKSSQMNYILNIASERKPSLSEVNFIQVQSQMEEKPSFRNLGENEEKVVKSYNNSSILDMSVQE